MNDEGTLFLNGMVVGAILIVLLTSIYWGNIENKCAKEHIVYECEYVYVPVDTLEE